MTRYVPLLKGKQGEYKALADLAPSTRLALQPLIELVPGEDTEPAADAAKFALWMGRVWGNLPAFVDTGHFDLDRPVEGERGLLAVACNAAEEQGVIAVPVLRLSDSDLTLEDADRLHGLHGRGACLRVNRLEDFDADGDELDEQIQEVLDGSGLRRPDLDLLIDAGAIDGDVPARTAAREVRILLRELPRLNEYRSVTVAGGAFPADLSGVQPWTIHERSRYDADLWTFLVGRGVPRAIDYGDYAIAHPALPEGPGFRAAPQLRYMTDVSWLVLKGTLKDSRAHDQFFDICDEVAAHPRFAGAALGPSDRRIANSRAHANGNATTWRQIGTAHHLDYVVRRLTSLGEP